MSTLCNLIALGAVGVYLAVSNALVDAVGVNGDSMRDLVYGLAMAEGRVHVLRGPSVSGSDFSLGPHWYHVVGLALAVTRSAWSLVALRWLTQWASVALMLALGHRLRGGVAGWVAALLLLAHPSTTDIFGWFTHPMLALPLVLAAMALAERWVADDDPRMGSASLVVCGLALQMHFAAVAALLVVLAAAAFVARPMRARDALFAVATFAATFLPTEAWQDWETRGNIPDRLSASILVPALVALFLLLWRGRTRRDIAVYTLAAVAVGLWAARMVTTIPGRRVNAVHFFNLRFSADLGRVVSHGYTPWYDVARGGFLQLFTRSPLMTPSLLLAAAGIAAVALDARRTGPSTPARHRARLMLLWLACGLTLAVVSSRYNVTSRYFMVVLPCVAVFVGAGVATLVHLVGRQVTPLIMPRVRAGIVPALTALLCAALAGSFAARYRAVRLPLDPVAGCPGDLVRTLRFAEALRSRGLPTDALLTRVHGQLGRVGMTIDASESLVPLVLALGADGARAPTTPSIDATHWRLQLARGGIDRNHFPFMLVPFMPALDLAHVQVLSGPTTGTTVSLPMRLSWVEEGEPLLPLFPLTPLSNEQSANVDLALRRRPGVAWPPGVALVAYHRAGLHGDPCRIDVEAGGATVQTIPVGPPTRTLMVVRGLGPGDDALRVSLRGCRFEYLDAWDLAAGEAP